METKLILTKVKNQLYTMGLTLSDSKTRITNLNIEDVLFLGTIIRRASKYSFSKPKHNNILRRNSKNIRLEAPISRIVKKLHNADFMKNNIASPKFV